MANQLTTIADKQRATLLASNRIVQTNPYTATHPDALSDGDSYGRGEYQTVIGTREDLAARKLQTASNLYGPGKEYTV